MMTFGKRSPDRPSSPPLPDSSGRGWAWGWFCQRIFNSWLSAVAVIFLAFAAAALLLDDFPIYADGLFSLATAGYTDDPPDVALTLERLQEKSQQHVPGYFLLLFVWGNLLDWTPLALKLLTVFCGIFSLALMYRLARSLLSREAGLIALVMLASLAFYNIWYLPIRMYTMFVAAQLLLLWLYFRALRSHRPSRRQLIALALACSLYLYTHIFSLATIVGIGLHHLVFVRKTRAFYLIAGAFLLAGLSFLPWLDVLIRGTEFATGRAAEAIHSLSAPDLLRHIIMLGINSNPVFLLLLPLSVWRARQRDRIAIAIGVITLAALAFCVAVNALTGVVDYGRLRYLVFVLPLIALLMTLGLSAIADRKLILIGILALWIASGLLFQRRVAPGQFVRAYDTIPIHLIERHLRDDFRPGDILTGFSPGLNLYFESWMYGGLADYYFGAHGIEVAIEHTYALSRLDAAEIDALLRAKLAGRERVWLVYDRAGSQRFLHHWRELLRSGYELCAADDSVSDLRIELYQAAGCD